MNTPRERAHRALLNHHVDGELISEAIEREIAAAEQAAYSDGYETGYEVGLADSCQCSVEDARKAALEEGAVHIEQTFIGSHEGYDEVFKCIARELRALANETESPNQNEGEK